MVFVTDLELAGLVRRCSRLVATITAAALGCSGSQVSDGGGGGGDLVAIVVAPDSVTLDVSTSLKFRATAVYSDHSTGTATVVWSTPPGNGSITSGGTYTAPATPGTYRAIATAGALADTAEVEAVVTTPPPTNYPHQPSGMSVIVDEAMNSKTHVGAWDYREPEYTNRVESTTDKSAPKSPDRILRFVYPQGLPGGQGAGASELNWNGVHTLYVAMFFKHAADWDFHPSGVNKMIYLGTNEDGPGGLAAEFFIHYRDDRTIAIILQAAQDYTGDSQRLLTANVNSSPVREGTWHVVELVATGNNGSAHDGTATWWVDGRLVGQYTNVAFKTGSTGMFDGLILDPIWGGIGATKSHDDTFDVDHLYISGK